MIHFKKENRKVKFIVFISLSMNKK